MAKRAQAAGVTFLILFVAAILSWFISPIVRASGYRVIFFSGVRPASIWSLEQLTALGSDGAKPLGEVMLDQSVDSKLREKAIHALAGLEQEAAPAIPALITALESDPQRWIRYEAAICFDRMGPAAAPAVPALTRALRDSEPDVRSQSASALGRIGPAAVSAVPQLIEALSDPNEMVRFNVAGSLGMIGPAAKAAVPALRKTLKDKNATVRHFAEGALSSIQAE